MKIKLGPNLFLLKCVKKEHNLQNRGKAHLDETRSHFNLFMKNYELISHKKIKSMALCTRNKIKSLFINLKKERKKGLNDQ